MCAFKIDVTDQAVKAALDNLAEKSKNMSPAMRAIARLLRNTTEDAFAKQASPFGPSWAPLKKSTLKGRKGGGAGAKILQDSGQLASSITATSDSTSATVTVGKVYAAIHQFGGQIVYAPRSIRVRLRTDRKGNLLRQEGKPNLAVFAKDKHKRAVTVWGESAGWSVQIKARPFLPVDNNGNLAPDTQRAVTEMIGEYLAKTK